MPFILSKMEQADRPIFAAIETNAMHEWPIHIAMKAKDQLQYIPLYPNLPGPDPDHDDPNSIWLKVSDGETGEMAAGALWTWQLEEKEGGLGFGEAVDRQQEARENALKAEQSGKIEGGKEDLPTIWQQMRKQGDKFRAEFFPTQPHFTLVLLMADPKWRNRGAAGMLVKYGCEKADEAGLMSVLTASEMGVGLYKKHRFEVVQENYLDLSIYGVEGGEVRRCMIRQPQSKS